MVTRWNVPLPERLRQRNGREDYRRDITGVRASTPTRPPRARRREYPACGPRGFPPPIRYLGLRPFASLLSCGGPGGLPQDEDRLRKFNQGRGPASLKPLQRSWHPATTLWPGQPKRGLPWVRNTRRYGTLAEELSVTRVCHNTCFPTHGLRFGRPGQSGDRASMPGFGRFAGVHVGSFRLRRVASHPTALRKPDRRGFDGKTGTLRLCQRPRLAGSPPRPAKVRVSRRTRPVRSVQHSSRTMPMMGKKPVAELTIGPKRLTSPLVVPWLFPISSRRTKRCCFSRKSSHVDQAQSAD